MKKVFFFAFAVLFFNACLDPENPKNNGSVNLTFKALYDNQPLVMTEYYDYPDGSRINYGAFRFYITDITLLNGSEETKVRDVAEINLSNNHNSIDTDGETIVLEEVPMGSYTGIKFGLGVAADLNAQSPADFDRENPLSNTGNYWSWRESYIFAQIEGHLDTVGNAQELDVFFTYHTGNDANYRTVELNHSFELEKKEEDNINIALETKDIFVDAAGHLDIISNNVTHSSDIDGALVTNLSDNFSGAFRIE